MNEDMLTEVKKWWYLKTWEWDQLWTLNHCKHLQPNLCVDVVSIFRLFILFFLLVLWLANCVCCPYLLLSDIQPGEPGNFSQWRGHSGRGWPGWQISSSQKQVWQGNVVVNENCMCAISSVIGINQYVIPIKNWLVSVWIYTRNSWSHF